MRLAAMVASLVALGALGTGCTVLTSSDPGVIHCVFVPDEPDPCPEGLACIDGACGMRTGCLEVDPCNGLDDDCDGTFDEGTLEAPACASGEGACVDGTCRGECVPEICDGLDNDCDGTPDNGLTIDSDGDDYDACDTEDPSRTDCDDRNAAIHPGAEEACNGFDDDCNGATAESAVGVCEDDETCRVVGGALTPQCVNLADCQLLITCVAPTVCDGQTARCCNVSDGDCTPIGDCRASGCSGGQECLQGESGLFACATPYPNGTGCRADGDCASGRCYLYAALALTPPGDSTIGVCGTPCCVADECGPDTVCWAPGTGARACLPSSLLGTSSPTYELCDAYEDCGSDFCAARAVTTPTGSGPAYTCGGAPGTAQVFCSSDSDCQTGFCYSSRCRYPCSDDAACERTLDEYCDVGFGQDASCASIPATGGGRLAACLCRGGGETGAACSANADCRDFFCAPGLNQCAEICCNDASCDGGRRCTPVETAGAWGMYCLPDPGPGPG